MLNHAYRILAAVAMALTFTGCMGNGASVDPNPTATLTNAAIRFVHGSPDAGPVALYIDGNEVSTSITYGTVTYYFPVFAGMANTFRIVSVATGQLLLSYTPPTIATGSTNTVALSGFQGNGTLQASFLFEPTYNTPTGGASVIFHDVSTAASPTVTFGTFAPGGATYTPAGTTSFQPIGAGPGQGNDFVINLPTSAGTAPGVGFYAADGGTPNVPVAKLLPQADVAADSGNLLPYTDTALSPSLVVKQFSVFAIDAPGSGYALVGIYDQ